MWYYWLIGAVILIAVVAIVVYFATRRTQQRSAFDIGTGAGSGTRAGAAASGIFEALGGLAESIGIASDSGSAPVAEGV